MVICNNETINFDHSATDPDGDSLSYELVTPFAGAGPGNPQPVPPPAPNYPLVVWGGGYNATSPLGAGSTTSINPITGLLYVDANLLGEYVVAIRVNEWRNGVLLSSTTRDFLFKVVNCVIQLSADITPQEELPTFVSYCQGLTIQFKNESFGGTNYDWDFGVVELTSDVSNQFEPTYTFPAPGTYTVQLIVNKGWTCTDTSTATFIILDELILDYTVPDSICITNNSFDFDGSFSGPAGTTFSWDFGSHGTPSSATTLDVNDVVFDTSGFIPVLLTGTYDQCMGTKLDSIFIFRKATINFGAPNELSCVPYFAQFTDSSFADSQLSYFWEFGDGGSSNLQNPMHTYTYVDDFDVQLTIFESEGCMDTLTLLKPDLISVTPSPTSLFSVSPTITDIYHTLFSFTDESIDSDLMYYWFNDSVSSTERNTTFSYVEGGYHSIFQVVINEFGCRDIRQ